jgi:hypothetical protein
MAPLAWLGWLSPILLAAGVVTPTVATVLGIRLLQKTRRVAGNPD